MKILTHIRTNVIYIYIRFIAFVSSVIDASIGFYIIRSLSYYKCERRSHQKDMATTSPVENMVKNNLFRGYYNLKTV